jgi:hypothetical protein
MQCTSGWQLSVGHLLIVGNLFCEPNSTILMSEVIQFLQMFYFYITQVTPRTLSAMKTQRYRLAACIAIRPAPCLHSASALVAGSMCLRHGTRTAAAGCVMRIDGLAPHGKGTAEGDARKLTALPPQTQLCIPG